MEQPSDQDETVELEILREVPGRVVLAEDDGTVHVCRNCHIFRSSDDGETWTKVSSLPRGPVRRMAEFSRLACRLLRHEVRALARHPDGTYVAANRQGVFFGRSGDRVFARSALPSSDLRLYPPMRISVGPDGTILWGEYLGVIQPNREIRLLASRDGGRSFQVIHTFERGATGHVHNVVYDENEGHYWVLVGDHGMQAGIAKLSADLQHLEWFVRGDQQFRAVELFDFGAHLLYGIDSEVERCGIVRLDKTTRRPDRIRDLDGSCIYGCRFGGVLAITTTVEPSEVIETQWTRLWLSRDGVHWKRAFRTKKDMWNPTYFQFGSIVLPSGATGRETIFFSGQATRGIDGRTIIARLKPGATL